MSSIVEDRLIEEACEYINSGELSGTGLDHVMKNNMVHNDIEALWQNIIQARELLQDD